MVRPLELNLILIMILLPMKKRQNTLRVIRLWVLIKCSVFIRCKLLQYRNNFVTLMGVSQVTTNIKIGVNSGVSNFLKLLSPQRVEGFFYSFTLNVINNPPIQHEQN